MTSENQLASVIDIAESSTFKFRNLLMYKALIVEP